MAILFTEAEKYVSWGNQVTSGLTTKTHVVTLSSFTIAVNGTVAFAYFPNASIVYFQRSDPNYLVFYYSSRATTSGVWYATYNNAITNQIVVTYDASSTANDPIIYANGAALSITENTAPAGAELTNTTNYIGTQPGFNAVAATIYSCLTYNRIFTATEVLDSYNSRNAIPTYNGLVFAPDLRGAVGVDDGDTLGATNYMRDFVDGVTGTPSGSPVFVADTYLNWR